MVRVAVCGCLHGELDSFYDCVRRSESASGRRVDLAIICGDFQAARDDRDLRTVSMPPRYRRLGTFRNYLPSPDGAPAARAAPCPTLFVGGNHEASEHMRELQHGGWAAPNIWYMGAAGVVTFAGLRIAGVSGIFKPYDYARGYDEQGPGLTDESARSAYHTREFETFRLAQLRGSGRLLDVLVSHEWPRGIVEHGDAERLFRAKSDFRAERRTLGSPALSVLLEALQPAHWFAAHLHVKFPAVVRHAGTGRLTKFLALDKVLPGRDFMQVLDIEPASAEPLQTAAIAYDPEWLCIAHAAHALYPAVRSYPRLLPRPEMGAAALPPASMAPSAERVKAVELAALASDGSSALVAPPASEEELRAGWARRDMFLRLLERLVGEPLPSQQAYSAVPVPAPAAQAKTPNPEEIDLCDGAPDANPEEIDLDETEQAPASGPNPEEIDLCGGATEDAVQSPVQGEQHATGGAGLEGDDSGLENKRQRIQ
eukprot:m51a1_g6673 putative lariat debranching enzyme (484) ;mRNA; f:207649-209100